MATGLNSKRIRTARWVLLIALSLGASAAQAASQLSLKVQANRQQLYLGESVLVSVTITGISNPPKPDLSAIRNCRIRALGKKSESKLDFSTGQFQQKTVFPFEITPHAAGPFVAGPVRIAYDGKVKTVRGPVLQVAGVEKQDVVEISITSSRESVIIDEPFEITAAVTIRALSGGYSDHHPLDPRQPPALDIPFLREIDGLKVPDIRSTMQKMVISRRDQPGFTINDIPIQNNFFSSARLANFSLPKRTIMRSDGKFHTYEFKLDYVAKKEGDYTFGPVKFKGPAVVSVAPGGRIVTRPILAVGSAATVRVLPPPEEGRPTSFIGAIGRELTVTAELDAQTCNVGDPLTLTLAISGKMNMSNVTPPLLNQQEALTRDFRIYDDTLRSESRDEKKIYRYTIRPTRVGTYEFPAVAISFYDVESQAYKTAYSQPLPIRAKQGVEVGSADVISEATNRLANVSFSSEQNAWLASPITMNPLGSRLMPLAKRPVHAIIAASGPCLLALILGMRAACSLHQNRQKGKRRRRAAGLAATRLKRAERENDADVAVTQISKAMREYLADTFEISGAGLTPADAGPLLEDSDPDVRSQYLQLFEAIFNAEFSESDRARVDTPRAARDALILVQKLETRNLAGKAGKQDAS
jgi:hypothetical protein